jgi:hypothetical protein
MSAFNADACFHGLMPLPSGDHEWSRHNRIVVSRKKQKTDGESVANLTIERRVLGVNQWGYITCRLNKVGEMTPKAAREQVDKNYDAFVGMLPSILPVHQNKYALLKDGEVVGFYSTLEDAYMTANRFFPDQPFSVQKVTDMPVDLGFFSHAVGSR